MPEPECGGRKPEVLELEPGEYWWCACGKSKDQPWCDGSHKGCGISPEKVVIEEKRRYALCTCKQSANGAICDGAHKNLPQE